VVTDPPTYEHTHPQTGPITIHCSAASAQCKYDIIYQVVGGVVRAEDEAKTATASEEKPDEAAAC